MLSRAELERAARLLHVRLAGGHLDRIVQRDAVTLELTITEPPAPSGGRARCHLVLSCDPRHARAGEAETFGPAPPAPLVFAQLLRAHAGRARIEGASITPGERQIALSLASGEGAHGIVLQILGPRSNVYLLGASGEILGSLRPLTETRRDLEPGAALTSPATPAPAAGEDRFAHVSDAGFLRAVEAHYAAQERGQKAETLARRIARALERERQRLLRREAALRRDLAQARPAEELRRLGELLKGALHTLRRGAEEARVRDWETEQEIVIPLESGLTPAKNLEKLFAGYQRARRREEAAAVQAESLETQRAALAALRERFASLAGSDLPDPEALTRFAGRPEVARLIARHPLPGEGPRPQAPRTPSTPRVSRRGETPARLRPGRYRTSDGLEIWVGRSAEGNDHLTTRLARGNDLFFHVEASPGSHVVLRTAGRKEVPQESLLEAAELAVHFSKQRHAARATVHVAPIKDVRKPAGARPGLVHVLRGRTLSLRRDAARLARVLDARLDAAE